MGILYAYYASVLVFRLLEYELVCIQHAKDDYSELVVCILLEYELVICIIIILASMHTLASICAYYVLE
jgi:hypothetical protein